VEGGLRKWSISLYGSSVRVTWRRKRRLWRGTSLSVGISLGNLDEGSYARGLSVEGDSGTGVSLRRVPFGEPGNGVSVYREF
jgi:hypothetical protein